MTPFLQSIKILVLAVLISIGVTYVYAWTGPTATAPSGNVSAPINVGATSQVKSGGLWAGSLGTDGGATFGGNVGIGTASPTQKLDVAGNVSASDYYIRASGKWASQIGGAIPSGMIAMFDAACPSGWTRFAVLDALFPRGSSVYGGTGGSNTHNHTVAVGGMRITPSPGGFGISVGAPGTYTTSNVDSKPPYLDVIWCKKN